jgi:hypothetical protein
VRRCQALKGDGTRCKARAMEGSTWCFNHDPAKAQERSANARKGGRTGGRGRGSLDETTQAKKYIRGLVVQLLNGGVQREVATACFMGLNILARYVELERRIRESDELEARIEALEVRQRLEAGGNRRSWHHR